MKRDFELIRKLLLFFEQKEETRPVGVLPIEGYSDNQIMYHCMLLYDAGLLRCEPIKSRTSDRVVKVVPFELTWDGHEFLDRIRSDDVWNNINKLAKSKGISLSYSLINQLADKIIAGLLLAPKSGKERGKA